MLSIPLSACLLIRIEVPYIRFQWKIFSIYKFGIIFYSMSLTPLINIFHYHLFSSINSICQIWNFYHILFWINMQIKPYVIISDYHNLFFHIYPFRKIICFRQILYIFCEIVFSFVKKFYYHLPHQFCKSLSGAKQCIKAQLKYVFFLNLMLTNAHFKPFFRLLEIPNTENRHPSGVLPCIK